MLYGTPDETPGTPKASHLNAYNPISAMHFKTYARLLCIFSLSLSSLQASPQVYSGVGEHQKIVDVLPAFQGGFGTSLAVNGELIFVFEPANINAANNPGTLFTYERAAEGWLPRQEIIRPPGNDPAVWQQSFGDHIAMDGDTIAVTNTLSFDHEGSIAILEESQGTWQIVDELQAPLPDDFELFGHSMALSGDSMIVGAPNSFIRRSNGGIVYFYERVNGTWQFQQSELGFDPSIHFPMRPVEVGRNRIQFYAWYAAGSAVAIHGDVAAFSYRVVTTEENTLLLGKVFVFERINGVWTQTQILKDPDSGGFNHFGRHSIEISDDQIIVGDQRSNDAGECFGNPGPGEVLVFERTSPGPGNWGLVQRFHGSNDSTHIVQGCTASDAFGRSMSLLGNRLLVGASRGKRDPSQNNTYGEAYLFERDSSGVWNEIEHYRHSDWNHRDNGSSVPGFGGAVSLSENYALVGHRLAFGQGGARGAGAAYVFELPHGTAYCDMPANSTGEMATLTATGNLDPAAGILTLWGEDLPPGNVSLLLASNNQGLVSQPGGSLGDLCLSGPLARISVQLVDGDGRVRFAADPLAMPITPSTSILSGETWYFQAYYRDQWLGASTNFTQATAVSFP